MSPAIRHPRLLVGSLGKGAAFCVLVEEAMCVGMARECRSWRDERGEESVKGFFRARLADDAWIGSGARGD